MIKERGRGGSACGAALIVAAAVAMVAAPPASAGLWMRALCQNPDGTAAPIDGLVFSGENVGQFGGASGTESCPGGQPLVTPLGGTRPGVWSSVQADSNAATQATWTYSAPVGSTIAGGTITGVNVIQTTWGLAITDRDAWISSPGDDPSGADLIADCATMPASATNACAENPLANALAPSSSPVVASIPHPGGAALYMTAGCSTSNTDPCAYSGQPDTLEFTAGFDWADLMLSDGTPPTAAGFGGSLLASGSAHGTSHVTFTAEDPSGPGVYAVTVTVDGHVVYQGTPNSNGGRCVPVATDPTSGAWVFDYQQPCPASVQLDVSVDTTALSDGQHQLQVSIEDAAQNTVTALDQAFTTDNLTSTAGAGHEGTAPPPGSTTTTTTTTTSASTTSSTTPPGASPTGATYALTLDPATRRLTASLVRRAYRHSALTLSGKVITGSGVPAPGVTVTATSGLLAGGGSTRVAEATTDGTGHFVLTIPRGDSRQLALTAGTATVGLSESVTPGLSLRARSLPAARLQFIGRVGIDPAGGPPPTVEIEDRTPTGWQVLATRTAKRNGRFGFVYRASPLVVGYSFTIRAVTAATALWRGAASATTEVTVHA